jgi:hypothetical protein
LVSPLPTAALTCEQMSGEPDTERLHVEQLKRELEERKYADTAPVDDETAQHERRADKARYLREKLAERAEAEARAKAEAKGEDQA